MGRKRTRNSTKGTNDQNQSSISCPDPDLIKPQPMTNTDKEGTFIIYIVIFDSNSMQAISKRLQNFIAMHY